MNDDGQFQAASVGGFVVYADQGNRGSPQRCYGQPGARRRDRVSRRDDLRHS
jgi:hypothetical protein